MKYNTSTYGELKATLELAGTLRFRPNVEKSVDPDTGVETTKENGFHKAILWEETQKLVVSTTVETIVAMRKTRDNTKIVYKITTETSEKSQEEYQDIFFFLDKAEEF